MSKIDLETLQKFINEVQGKILTSNNILPRVHYPYYRGNNAPATIISFKERLETLRRIISDNIAALKSRTIYPELLYMNDFRKGTFPHALTGALAISEFGIGECNECSVQLAIKLVQAGYGDIAFVAIRFLDAEPDFMETTHQFIVANVPKLPQTQKKSISLEDFLTSLPNDALIGDTFLEVAFKPTSVPPAVTNYINKYGGRTDIIECYHFKNLPKTAFNPYIDIAKEILTTLRTKHPSICRTPYTLDKTSRIDPTTTLLHLNCKTELKFFAVKHPNYQVDAVTEIENQIQKQNATAIKSELKGFGTFFTEDEKEYFVLEGINLPENESTLAKSIFNYCKKI